MKRGAVTNTRDFDYEADGRTFTGFLADGSLGRKTAGVLLAPDGDWLSDHIRERARILARLGYVALAMDIFGKVFTTVEEGQAAIAALVGDLPRLRARASGALAALKSHPNVDSHQTAVIGFGFGRVTVLELGREGGEVAAVFDFHSGLRTTGLANARIKKTKAGARARVPIVSAHGRREFIKGFNAADVDWTMLLLGKAERKLTNSSINPHGVPDFAQNIFADERSWCAMLAYLNTLVSGTQGD